MLISFKSIERKPHLAFKIRSETLPERVALVEQTPDANCQADAKLDRRLSHVSLNKKRTIFFVNNEKTIDSL
jgi:hypothetical protein